MSRQPLSLKARAIALLAQREHSSAELRRKLARIARERDAQAEAKNANAAEPPDPGKEVETLLVWLQAHGYLNESRFVESRIHARATRHGNLRIRQELAQHGLTPDAEQLENLKDSELERARAVWQRKFGNGDEDGGLQTPEEAMQHRARQIRFLAARGFAPETIRQLLRDPFGTEA